MQLMYTGAEVWRPLESRRPTQASWGVLMRWRLEVGARPTKIMSFGEAKISRTLSETGLPLRRPRSRKGMRGFPD